MKLDIIVLLFVFVVLPMSSAAQEVRTATLRWEKGLQLLAVPLRSYEISTVADLARITRSRVVGWTQQNRIRVWIANAGFPAAEIAGNRAYLVYCPASGQYQLFGKWWGASLLKITRSPGLQWIANIRPSGQPVEQFVRSNGLLGITQLMENRWQVVGMENRDSLLAQQPFDVLRGYGILSASTTTTEPIMLPNSNQPPHTLFGDVPLIATTNAVFTIASRTTDLDDEPETLTHEWSVSSDWGTLMRTSGAAGTLAASLPGRATIHLVSSDGLSSSEHSRVVSVETALAPNVSQLTYTLNRAMVDFEGLRCELPYLYSRIRSITPMLGPFPAYRLSHHAPLPAAAAKTADTTQEWHVIDLSSLSGIELGEWPYGGPPGSPWPVPATFSVDTRITTTDPFVTDILAEIGEGDAPFRFFTFSQPIIASSKQGKTVGETMKRVVNTKLLTAFQRFSPINLLARATNQVAYNVSAVDPANNPDGKIAVVMFHGFDVRSEFFGVGPSFLAPQHEWPWFFGVASNSPAGIRENIRDLQKKFVFWRAVYPTGDDQDTIASRVAERMETSVFANGRRPELLFVGNSMGGLIARRVRNKFVGQERIGQRVTAVITTGTPHHGAAMPTALAGGLFLDLMEQMIYGGIGSSIEAFLPYGTIPPSRGLRSLAYDASVVGYGGRRADASLNPELTRFNEEDVYRNTSNLYVIAGGTTGTPLPDKGLEIARNRFEYKNIAARGFSDGVVVTQSSMPMDLAQLRQSGGSTNNFIGRRNDGSIDRLAYFDGVDHYELIRNPEIICAIHSLIAQFAGNDTAPIDSTPDEIDHRFPKDSASSSVTLTQTVTWEDDGNSVVHAWTIARTIPEASAQISGADTANPTITVDRPTNVLLWHTVRDGRGGVTAKIVDVYFYAPRPQWYCGPIGQYRVTLDNAVSGASLTWSVYGSGCLPQHSEWAILWTDPTDDNTKSSPRFDRSWPHRTLYYFYSGPSINNGPSVFSNVAIARPRTNPTIP